MKLKYHEKLISATETFNTNIIKFSFQKLYYAVIIRNCNRYSSIANKQRVDVIMLDDNLTISSIRRGMHENTFFATEGTNTTILLPLNYFPDLEIGQKIIIEK